jgi:hypothetical protein
MYNKNWQGIGAVPVPKMRYTGKLIRVFFAASSHFGQKIVFLS